LVEERVAVLGYGCSKDNNLVDLADAFEEGINARALDYVDVVILAFNFDGNCEIGLVKNLTMYVLATGD